MSTINYWFETHSSVGKHILFYPTEFQSIFYYEYHISSALILRELPFQLEYQINTNKNLMSMLNDTTIYKTLRRKLKIEEREPHYNQVNSGSLERKAVPAQHVASVVLRLLRTR